MAIKQASVSVRAGRVHCGYPREDYIDLTIEDEVSGIEFASVQLSLADFGLMMTGGTARKLKAELRGLESIGKVREYRPAKITLSEAEYEELTKGVKWSERDEVVAKWLRENHQWDGWSINTYLGSRGSIETDYKTKIVTINIGYTRYVDPA